MDRVDGSDHYNKVSNGISLCLYSHLTIPAKHSLTDPPPSLLVIILDTNPHAWAQLKPTLPLPTAVANLLVFISAHLACNNANQVSVIASHTQRAEFLIPSNQSGLSSDPGGEHMKDDQAGGTSQSDEDVEMTVESAKADEVIDQEEFSDVDANQYRPFAIIRQRLFKALRSLYDRTDPSELTATTAIAGALTLALTYINKQQFQASIDRPAQSNQANGTALGMGIQNYAADTVTETTMSTQAPRLLARILILSVSGDLAHQYIPIMNTIFACQRLTIPIDICKISGDTIFLQQASDATNGTYINLDHPRGLLQYLMMAFLPDQTSRQSLVQANAVGVDFRAACFCHRKVVDTGWVCSICLSIFCSPPAGSVCLTCGTRLRLGNYNVKPPVAAKKKKTKKKVNGS